MFKSVFINLFLATTVWCLERGDTCNANGKRGICKAIDECPAAVTLLTVEEKKPPMCKWEGFTRIVCCSVEDESHTLGVFRTFFSGTKDGVLRAPDMTCRYKGVAPMTCCHNAPTIPEPPEPEECPQIALPERRRNDIAWKKCLEYQRYVHVCVASNTNPDKYIRDFVCDMDTTSDRIIGGIPSRRKEFPHMALLGCRNIIDLKSSYIVWVGGGALISEKYILTAAHVLSHAEYGLVRYALLGATNKSDVRDGILYNIIRHEPYKLHETGGFQHDIALLELDRKVQFSEFIRPVCLPMPGVPLSSERIIAGWGKTEFGTASPLLLKAVLREIDSIAECQRQLGIEEQRIDPATILCAEGKKNDSCQGDSGGPLLAYTDAINCTYVARGVVSWGQGCGKGTPAVYTNVEYYMKWIVDTVWPEGSN